MAFEEKKSPPVRRRIPANVIDVESPTPHVSVQVEEPEQEAPSSPGTDLVVAKRTEFEERLIDWSKEAKKSESSVEELDLSNSVDSRISKVSGEEVGDLIDITRLGGRLMAEFCVAPIKYSGQKLHRRRRLDTADVHYFVGRSVRINKWHMYFEPGTIMPAQGGKRIWREGTLPIPHAPLQFRGDTPGRLIAWQQDWSSYLLLPTNPVVLDHVAGDVYRLVGGWQFSDLEVAAMRKVR